MMRHLDLIDDCSKMRLTSVAEILRAIHLLRSRGYDHDDLATEITRIFYVDLDAFNEAVRAA